MTTIAIIRASTAAKHRIGYADIEVWTELAKKGYSIHIFLQGQGNLKKVTERVHIWEIGFQGIPIMSTFIYWLISFYKILKIRPNVIIAHYTSLPICIICKIFLRDILIIDVRSIPVLSIMSILNRVRYEVPLKASFKSKFVDGITVISEGMLIQIIKEYKVYPRVPICIWPSGFNPRYFNKKVNGEKLRAIYSQGKRLILLYHGSIAKERGLCNLIYAIKLLNDYGIRNIGLWILGEGKDKTLLQQLVVQLGLQENVLFLDPVPYHKVAEFIAAADACVSPLPRHRWWMYQFPLKVVECLAVGKPVIATDIWCHKQIGGGIVFSHGDSARALANAIMSCISPFASQFLEKLSEEAVMVSKSYSWENHALVIHEYLKFLLSKRDRLRFHDINRLKLFEVNNKNEVVIKEWKLKT
jgi:glycosyltransferase involved in cell wall biosynthesis